MTPNQITPGTYFICGPIKTEGPMFETINTFLEKQNMLESFGVKVFNPMQIFNDWHIDDFSITKFEKYIYSCLVQCDKVITINDWDCTPYSKKIVDTARVMEKEIISYSRFILDKTRNA